MARRDWSYVNIENHLMSKIDKVVEDAKDDLGLKKYEDRRDFITEAIRDLLNKESEKLEVAAA